MADFKIAEDFSENEIGYDKRFSDPKACYDYLFKQKWNNGFICKKCGHGKFWVTSRNLYNCTQCEHQHSLIAGATMDSTKKPPGLKPCGGSQPRNPRSMLLILMNY